MSCPSCVVIPPTASPSERVALLMRYAQEGARDPRVQTIAQALLAMLSQRLQRRPTSSETAQFFADALHLLTQYLPDPDGQEVFQSVQQTLGGGCGSEVSPITGKLKGCGDCEDLAAAFVALCMVVGIPSRVVWLEQPGAPLNHVSAQVRTDPARPEEWLWMETTIPGARLGENPYGALQRLGEQFRTRVFGVEDIAAPAGFLFNVALNLPTPTPASTTDLIVVGMPHGGVVDVDNARIVVGSWDDAELTRWRVRVPANVVGGLRRVLVTAPDGSQREQFVSVPGTGSVEVQHATMTPPVQGSVAPARVVVDAMPHGGGVLIDSTPVSGVWLDPSLTRWAVTVPPGLAGARRRLAVQREGEATLSGLVDVPRTGDAVVRYGQLRADGNVLVDASGSGADLIVVGMPHGGEVAIGGRLLTAGRWQDAEMTRWVVPVPPSFLGTAQEVRITSGRSPRTQTVTLPTAGVAVVQFTSMNAATFTEQPLVDPAVDPTVGGPGSGVSTLRPAELVIAGMPHGGSVTIGGTPVPNGQWLDAGLTRWMVPIPRASIPRASAGEREVVVEVLSAEAGTRRATVSLPRSGRVELVYANLRAEPEPVLEAPPEAPTLTIQAMPHYGVVGIDGVQVTTGRWADAGMTRWEIPLAPAQVGDGRLVTVAPPEGPTRSARVNLAPAAATVLDFAAMAPDTVTPMGRVVVRGAPRDVQARVVRLVDGTPTQAVYLDADPLGYLAKSFPVGSYHLELERESLNGRQTVRTPLARVPVTVALDLDSVYDVTPEGLAFRANVTDARVSPRALTATARVTVTGVPKTDQTPGALNLDATVWSLRALAGPVGEGVSNENLPAEGARLPPPSIDGVQQPDGTSFVLEVPRGAVQFRLERIRRADGGGAQVLESYTLQRDVTGDVVIPFADFTRTVDAAPPAPGDAPVLRVTGVPDGWQVELTGAVVDGPRMCPSAIDGCEARVVPGGVVGIILRNAALGIQTARRLDAPTTSTTVDVSFDVRRALHLKAQPEGITSTNNTGLRCGYWSLADGLNPYIPANARHRVVREFEALTPPDAYGRTLRAVFVQGRGFAPAFGTDAQFARFARDLALLQTGRANAEGHFPFEVKGPTVATAGA